METYNVLCTTNAVLQDELKIRERFKKMSCYYLCYYSLRRYTTTYIFRFIRELSKFVNYIKKNEIKRIKKKILYRLFIFYQFPAIPLVFVILKYVSSIN